MNHPYSSAASFIYPNEVRVPQKHERKDLPRPLPPLPLPAPPKARHPSSSTSSLPLNPPAYEESGWLSEDPYKKSPVSSISLSPVPPPVPPHANVSPLGPDAALGEYAHSAPLRPQRGPNFKPPPPPPAVHTGKRDSDLWSVRSVGSVKFRARITKLYRKRTTSTTTAPDAFPDPPTPKRRDSGPVSEWVDDEDDEDYEDARANSRSSGTKAKPPMKGPHAAWRTKGPPSAWPPTKPGVVIRYEGEDESEALRRRRLKDKKHDEWRKRMIDRFSL
ncbi:hypothetical protein C8F04DRAFT_282936 [Mycena alexandri]|uniref:Uncharacterized protein n=1 Tax=Mycena alexandri TaxID=1745969 RepID=A0AAD6T529_9AGAR|nr:hypothetical protein C8F04DRAFT_282936 [Mycena alexandri]